MKNCTRYGHAAASRAFTRFHAQFHANPAADLCPDALGSLRNQHHRRPTGRFADPTPATVGDAPPTLFPLVVATRRGSR
ncbi:hypothetical protein C1I93_28140 [Micromonospora endophytica]|uniref:Uncharacterized protein n=1 Tax=Micromonospora endophytica TaxID=515350 RepID=A0A2W2BEG0_9ACTN|nr:hypothetical protein C1I93_28140 [Micromonospora endophytica]RIW45443.1 hypothetical protein D3H59_15280 [Micromonospora endophytica]